MPTPAARERSSHHAVGVLLAVLRVLLNLTHDNELGSHRLGEQEGAVKTVLDIIFLLCDVLPDEHRFDTNVLGLGLLINMIEHNSSNRQQLDRLPVDYHVPLHGNETLPTGEGCPPPEVKGDDETSQEEGRGLLKGRNTCVRSLIALFLKHYHNAEGATIEEWNAVQDLR
ncbi:Wings apart-like protein homolog [Geodia barretti]|uniref:Wings apart-like protein homolog n=1 Tax=Geodia barretti TaxID=519541 RepID=A0AA35SCQ8_GEOBA|nr:Wings apart-like protein homolog [Geodia barretti]